MFGRWTWWWCIQAAILANRSHSSLFSLYLPGRIKTSLQQCPLRASLSKLLKTPAYTHQRIQTSSSFRILVHPLPSPITMSLPCGNLYSLLSCLHSSSICSITMDITRGNYSRYPLPPVSAVSSPPGPHCHSEHQHYPCTLVVCLVGWVPVWFFWARVFRGSPDWPQT